MAVKTGKTIDNVIRGDSRQVNLTFLESDGTTPIDLNDGTVYFTVNLNADPTDDTTKKIQKIITTGFTDPTNGKTTILLSHDDTNIDAASYWYDAQFIDSDGNYLSSYRGRFNVQSDTTRA